MVDGEADVTRINGELRRAAGAGIDDTVTVRKVVLRAVRKTLIARSQTYWDSLTWRASQTILCRLSERVIFSLAQSLE